MNDVSDFGMFVICNSECEWERYGESSENGENVPQKKFTKRNAFRL